MIERVILSLTLISLSVLAFHGFTWWQRQQMSAAGSRATAAGAPSDGAARPTILYFRSDACAPCHTQARFLDRLAADYEGRLDVRRIDTDEDPEMAGRYRILTLPTTLVLDRQGQVQHINYGLADPRKLARQLESVG